MGHPVHFLKSYSIFPSNFSAVPGDDDRAVLHPGGQPLVQVLLQAWLPDGYSQILRIVCVLPFGLLDYGSATLRCKI